MLKINHDIQKCFLNFPVLIFVRQMIIFSMFTLVKIIAK